MEIETILENGLPDYTKAPWCGILLLFEKYNLEIVLKEKL